MYLGVGGFWPLFTHPTHPLNIIIQGLLVLYLDFLANVQMPISGISDDLKKQNTQYHYDFNII